MWIVPPIQRLGRTLKKNISLGKALDKVNPFSNQSLSHSTWQVVLLNYSLLAWLATKPFFLMLALLIPQKESVTSKNIDVYLVPLIEEMFSTLGRNSSNRCIIRV
jgi:hypothetical protein